MPKYVVISQSDPRNTMEIQGVPVPWDTSGPIVRSPVVGDEYWDPNTQQVSNLYGRTRYQPITLSGVFTVPEYDVLRTLYESAQSTDGSLTATHKIADKVEILTGVRLGEMSHGEINRLSNSPVRISLQISFTGLRAL